jgi:hypothetical protein
MKLLVATLGSLLLLALAVFCAFGFMATFEPAARTAEFLAFRIGYAVIGIGCLVGAGVLLVKAMRKRDEHSPRRTTGFTWWARQPQS